MSKPKAKITVVQEPSEWMPANNPINFILETSRNVNWEGQVCDLTKPRSVSVQVWELRFCPSEIFGGVTLTIADVEFTAIACADTTFFSLVDFINIDKFLQTGLAIDFALEFIKSVNSSLKAQNKFFALEWGRKLTICKNIYEKIEIENKVIGGCAFVYVIGKNYGDSFSISQFPAANFQIFEYQQAEDNRNENYLLKSFIMEETDYHNSNNFVKKATQNGSYVLKKFDVNDTCYDPYDLYLFDFHNILKPNLGEDVPNLTYDNIQVIRNAAKKYKIVFFDEFYNEDFGKTNSKFQETVEFNVLNARFALYKSSNYNKLVDSNNCTYNELQDYLLEPYFSRTAPRKFLTEIRDKVYYINTLEFLYWFDAEGQPDDYKILLEFTKKDLTEEKVWSTFSFEFFTTNCEAKTYTSTNSIVAIPLHKILENFNLQEMQTVCVSIWIVDGAAKRVSEKIRYKIQTACDDLLKGLMFVNKFGMNEITFIEAKSEDIVKTEKQQIEKDIANANITINSPEDFQIISSSSITRQTTRWFSYTTQPPAFFDELFAASRVRLIKQRCEETRVCEAFSGEPDMFPDEDCVINPQNCDLPCTGENIGYNAIDITLPVSLLQATSLSLSIRCNAEVNNVGTCYNHLRLRNDNIEYALYTHNDTFIINCNDEASWEVWFNFDSLPISGLTPIFAKQRKGTNFSMPGTLEPNWPAFFLWVFPDGSLLWTVGMKSTAPNEVFDMKTAAGTIKIGHCYHVVITRAAGAYNQMGYEIFVNGVKQNVTLLNNNLSPNQCSLWQRQDVTGAPLYWDGGTGTTTVPNSYPIVNDGDYSLGVDLDFDMPRNAPGSSYFFGTLKSANIRYFGFRIYNKRLSHLEVLQNYNDGITKCPQEFDASSYPFNLVLNSIFNEISGFTITDLSGNGNNGALLPFGSYNVPLNSQVSYTPQTTFNFGVTPTRASIGGGTWTRTTQDDCLCCPKSPDSVTASSGVGTDLVLVGLACSDMSACLDDLVNEINTHNFGFDVKAVKVSNKRIRIFVDNEIECDCKKTFAQATLTIPSNPISNIVDITSFDTICCDPPANEDCNKINCEYELLPVLIKNSSIVKNSEIDDRVFVELELEYSQDFNDNILI